ncbi:MAG: hypothetical protein E7328_03070 [Clostridiales bacterium]|nr:hypothetical protein [Clostridiales bacterium]
MFGYVKPIMERLSEEEKNLFSSYYCGLCRAMGRKSRFTLSYDCAFLALILSKGEDGGSCAIRCKGNPFRKKQAAQTPVLSYCADVGTILSYHKVLDDIADEGGLRKRAAKWILKSDYKKAAKRSPKAAACIQKYTAELNRLEKERCPVSDMAADTTAKMMGELAGEEGSVLYRLFYHIGRWLYLMDAMEDYEADAERGGYNVLRLEWNSKEEAIGAMEFALWHALSVVEGCLQAIELTKTARGVAENVLYKAMSARTHLTLYGQEERKEVGSL